VTVLTQFTAALSSKEFSPTTIAMSARPHITTARLLLAAACIAVTIPGNPSGAQGSAAPPSVTPAASARFIAAEDLGRIVRVTDAQLAPDGRQAAILVARPNYDENRYVSDLVVVDVATRAQRVLSRDRRGLSSPRWSPSGDRIAFLASAPTANVTAAGERETPMQPQLFVLPMSGGESVRLTSVAGGVQHFAWRPDGQSIAYVAADVTVRKAGQSAFDDAFEAGNNDFLITAAPTSSHIWMVSAEGGAPRRLTSGAWSLPTVRPPSPPPSPLSWSPDGRRLAFTRVPTPRSGDFGNSTVQILDVETGAMRALTGDTANVGFGSFSPDGRQVAYWAPREGDTRNVQEVFVAPTAGGRGVRVTGTLDRNVVRSLWMPDGKTLLVGANDARQVGLWLQPIGVGSAKRLSTGGASPSSAFWVDVSISGSGQIAFTGTETGRPTELYYMASPSSPAQRLTDFNREIASLSLGRVETMEWTGADGVRSNGTVTYPPDMVAGRRYPLVLEIHGGPRAASLETFAVRPQLMAAKGWIVFQPNYRGSDNLGNAFQAAIWNDAGEGPGRDVMAGLAALVARGIVDTTRIAVSGWSYGGYMSTWLAGRYPGVWRAAVIGAPVTAWLDQYNLGDANVRRGRAFGGSPYTGGRMQAYLDQSPMRWAPAIKVPTLVMHNLRDDRVPVTQGYALARALRDVGTPVQFIVWPIAGHNAADPVRQRAVTTRWIDWIDRAFSGDTSRMQP
jgi:dipeptidyl aminopeptidase/acylaminoacyl peptidase